ncbi:MAG TPA: SNF2-related protein [Ktedonobacterales bacterium]
MQGPRLRFVRPDGLPPRTSSSSSSSPEQPAPGRRGLVAHAAWVPPPPGGAHVLALWAEVETLPPARPRRPSARAADEFVRERPHPVAAKHHEMVPVLERLWKLSRPGVRPRTTCTRAKLRLWLPATGARPLPSPDLVRVGWAADPALGDTDPDAAPLGLWRADALYLDPEAAGTLLSGLPHHGAAEAEPAGETPAPPRLLFGADLRFWIAAAKLTLDMLVRQRYLPGGVRLPDDPYYATYATRAPGPRVSAIWQAALADPEDRARFDALAAAMPDVCRAAATPGAVEPDAATAPSAHALLEDFTRTVLNARIQKWISQDAVPLRMHDAEGNPRAVPYFGVFATGGYYYDYGAYGYTYGYGAVAPPTLAERWLAGLGAPGRALNASAADARLLLEGIQRWHAGLSDGEAPFRLCFRLSPPGGLVDDLPGADVADADAPMLTPEAADLAARAGEEAVAGLPGVDATEASPTSGANGASAGADVGGALGTLDDDEPWRLDYLLQARDDLSLLLPLDEVWHERGEVAHFLERRFTRPHERVLASLGQAARLCEPIARSLRQARPAGCDLTGGEAYRFLSEVGALLEAAGFGVLVPAWWKRTPARPTLRLRLRQPAKTSTGLMGLDAVVAYDWKLALGGEELTRDELERLAALKEPLVRLRGKWVELRPEQMEAALRFARTHASGRMSLGEALRVSLTGEVEEHGIELEEVRADEWIGDLLGRLRGGEMLTEVPPPETLHGTLRPYQHRGLGWLAFLTRYGLGACLADDMGLGKTIELLALLLHQKGAGQLTRPVLLVCPTSVVGNWRHESARFAPDLRVLIHHGADRVGRAAAESFADEIAGYDLVVTTYSLLPRDEETLAGVDWGGVVLDEAQNIKNAETKQSRVARKLRAPMRAALTGTPVENRLAELWSIMDFLNPGYLGSHRRFHERFALPIEKDRDPKATARLQALARPFILRRLKTDPTVISDLPEKIEMREYCPLTREQVTLYEAVVRDGLRQVEEADEPMRRRGIVLAMLTRLKQVCNHPAHLLGDGSPLAGRSGKLTRLEELVEELLDEGDRALIFTQFTAMADRLEPYLRERFGTEVLYLHGGVPQHQRERLIARFQSEDGPPLFLLSLKAGGLGLNLTRANHVIHFDRWWNPAVENQATDRAFRIGQTRNVQVRKFVCTGTLEERIDAMIEQKRDLAENIVGTGEGWITELSTAQLRDLFSLRADALAD